MGQHYRTNRRKRRISHVQDLFTTISNHIYDLCRPSYKKSFVQEAQTNGQINHKQDDQVEAVQDIIKLLTVEPPISVVTRLISFFYRVNTCALRINKDCSAFVSRLGGLAVAHPMYVGVAENSHVGGILPITLLINLNRSEETFSNAKLQVVAMAKSRQFTASHAPSSLTPNAISQIQ